MKAIKQDIIDWLKSYLDKHNMAYYVVGISGGIDSAVTSTLCALTGKPTMVVSLPILQNKEQLKRANNHISWLKNSFNNVESIEVDLSTLYNVFVNIFQSKQLDNELGFANSRSRIRMTSLYQIASTLNGIVVGTGNKVEDFGVGFYTKYGDGGVDISPIADLLKSQVKELAKIINISEDIIQAQPTDGLWGDNRTDEDQIGATYEELEWAMSYNNEYDLNDRQKTVLDIFNTLNKNNKHKMQPIPFFKIK